MLLSYQYWTDKLMQIQILQIFEVFRHTFISTISNLLHCKWKLQKDYSVEFNVGYYKARRSIHLWVKIPVKINIDTCSQKSIGILKLHSFSTMDMTLPSMSQKLIFETQNCKLKVLTDRPNLDRLADYFLLFL